MSDQIIKTLLESLTSEQKAKLVADLMASVGQEKTPEVNTQINKEEVVSSTPRIKVNEDFTVVRDESLDQRKTAVKARKNQWRDEGEFKDEDIDYQRFERMKTPRKRTPPNKKTVECHVCGKTFSINENLIYGEYVRCNRCTGR